jgi:hypothetical protein
LLAFLAKVSTKLELIDLATVDNVAWRHQLRSAGKGVPIQPAKGIERSALRCSIVVDAFCACVHLLAIVGGSWMGQYQRFVHGFV